MTDLDGQPVPEEVAAPIMGELERRNLGVLCAPAFPALQRPLEIPFSFEVHGSFVTQATLEASTGNLDHDVCLTTQVTTLIFPNQETPVRVASQLTVPAL